MQSVDRRTAIVPFTMPNRGLAILALISTALPLLALSAPPTGDWAMQTVDDQPLAADPALDALVAAVGAWSERDTAPVVDLAAIASDPAAHHGRTFHLSTGPATRVASSAFDIPHLIAWQTTADPVSEPLLLLIYEPDGRDAPGEHVGSIELNATFWKSALANMRSTSSRLRPESTDPAAPPATERILVFVGALPTYSPATAKQSLAWGNLVAALLVGGALLFIVRRVALRSAGRRPDRVTSAADEEAWNDANLPAEPAEALAELRRRGGDTIAHD